VRIAASEITATVASSIRSGEAVSGLEGDPVWHRKSAEIPDMARTAPSNCGALRTARDEGVTRDADWSARALAPEVSDRRMHRADQAGEFDQLRPGARVIAEDRFILTADDRIGPWKRPLFAALQSSRTSQSKKGRRSLRSAANLR
jgi:hypothetical protein